MAPQTGFEGCSERSTVSLADDSPNPSMSHELSGQDAEQNQARELAERMFVEWKRNRSGAVIVPLAATVRVLELAAELFSQRADHESRDMKYEAELVIGARNPFRAVPRPSYFTFHRG